MINTVYYLIGVVYSAVKEKEVQTIFEYGNIFDLI
jgi:hypothetical protein